MWYAVLADALVAVHLALALFIVVGQLVIWLGLLLGWNWVRNPWFRWSHLAVMAIVGLEAIFGMACPLTTWEDELREAAGVTVMGGTFIGRAIHYVLFYDVDTTILNVAHIVFALLVIGTFVLAPPHWPQRRNTLPFEVAKPQG
jgi:hypothetical protein